MARTQGTFSLAGTIEPLVASSLDARDRVPAKADLTASGTFPYPYIGMKTYVIAENKEYRLIGEDPTVLANWQEIGSGGGGASSLSDLSDTTINSPSNGQVLKYDSSTSKWVNGNSSLSVAELGDIGDVDLDNLTDGQTIVWDAANSKWVNGSGGSGGTGDYADLSNKPSINSVTLSGNKTTSDLGISYNDLTNKPTIPTATSDLTNDSGFITSSSVPTATSDLTNDSGFITNAVNDLVSYYLKSETYTKTEVDSIATAIKNSRFEVVSELPTSNIKTNVIYLVPKASAQTNNAKDEYINLDGTSLGWEKIGDTEIDLSGYVTTSALNTALADYTTTADLTTLLAGYVETSDLATVATTGAYSDLTGTPDAVQVSTMPTAGSDYVGRIVQFTGTTGTYTNGYFYECVSDGEQEPTYSWAAKSVQAGGSGGASALDDLSDVSITSPSEGQILKYNDTSDEWENVADTGGGRELTATQYAGLSDQEKLNGTTYYITDGTGGSAYDVKKRVLTAGETSVTVSTPTTGDYITNIYTTGGIPFLSTSYSSSNNTLTVTFPAQSSNINVYFEFREV